MDSLDGFVSDDELLYEPMAERGWAVTPVSWRVREADWSRFDAVIIRTTWDYHKFPAEFLATMEEIDRSPARLENSLELLRWNMDKRYLRDLESDGVCVVPTAWGGGLRAGDIRAAFDDFQTEEIVVKPVIGAAADDTFRVSSNAKSAAQAQVETVFDGRDYMIQPFMRQIVEEGEFSLFFFGGAYSHAILKTPKPDDFRSQEEHGGVIRPVEPEQALLRQGRKALEYVEPLPLYARVDLVRTGRDGFAVMELELIEPALYFRMDPDSPRRFAKIFDEWMRDGGSSGAGDLSARVARPG